MNDQAPRTVVDPDPINPYGTDLCNGLVRCGASVRLLTAHGYRHASRATFEFVESAPMSAHGRHFEKAMQTATHILNLGALRFGARTSTVHFEWLRFPFEWRFLAMLREAGFPVLWTAHNVLPHEAGDTAREYHARLYSLPSAFIVHTIESRERLKREFGIDERRLHLVRPGMPSPPISAMPARDEARARLGLPCGVPIFLLFGQVRPYKGWQVLLDAFHAVTRASRDSLLVMAGRATPEVHGEVSAYASHWDSSAKARLTLRIGRGEFLSEEEAALLYRASDVVMVPYSEITHSGVMLQAYSYGRPVVCSALPGLMESLVEGVTGASFPAGDAQALAQLLEDLSTRGPNGGFNEGALFEEANRLHNWNCAARKTLDVYRSIESQV